MARILIVESSPSVAITEAYQLWNAGHDVSTTATAGEALDWLERNEADLIVLEYELPDVDGLTLLDRLHDRGVTLPAVMVSAQRDQELVVRALRHGVTDYLVKTPGAARSLDAAVHHALAEELAQRQQAEHQAELKRRERNLKRRKATLLRQLKQSRSLVQTVFEGYPHWMYVTDRRGRLVVVNRRMAADCGREPRDLIGKTCRPSGALTQPFCAVLRRHTKAVLADGRAVDAPEVRIPAPDGTVHTYALSHLPLLESPGEIVGTVVTVEDITARVAAEQERRLLAAAVSQTAESIVVADADGTVRYVNPAFERITGQARDAVLGGPAPFLGPEWSAPSDPHGLRRALERGEPWNGRMAYRRGDGADRALETTLSPIRDEDGQPAAYVAVNRDVTRQLQLEADLRQSQKLEAIGTMVSGIAHEINNILMPILGYAELLRLGLPADMPEREHAIKINQALLRARELISSILSVSRRSRPEAQPMALNRLAAEVMPIIHAAVPGLVNVHEYVSNEATWVMADMAQMQSVLMNLCLNAAHAMPEGGDLSVRLERVLLDADAIPRPELAPGPYACLSVSDTGTGMDETTRERIFEPFFTTKGEGEGTGLGLYTVYGIVKEHGGFVTVDSAPGRGTMFSVYLPCTDTAFPGATAERRTGASGGSASVLFVDDEEAVRRLGGEILTGWGYRVTLCADGREALTRFEADPEAYDIVIADLMSPMVLGDDLLARCRAIRPQVRCILSTGYPESAALLRRGLEDPVPVLRKPWTTDDLQGALESTAPAPRAARQPAESPGHRTRRGSASGGQGAPRSGTPTP